MSVAIVQQVKAELEAAGVDLSGPCGAFKITHRVGWRLRHQGWGFVAKRPEQNGCTINSGRYGVDVLAQQTGTCVDILINSETDNDPAWNLTGAIDPTTWRAPFEPPALSQPPQPPQPPIDVGQILTRLAWLSAQIAELTVMVRRLAARPAPSYSGTVAIRYLGSSPITHTPTGATDDESTPA